MKLIISLVPWLLVISGCTGYRILGVLPLAVRSHFMMHEELMKSLARKGHQVDVISAFPQKKPLANYTDVITVPVPRVFVNNLTYHEAQGISGTSFVSSLLQLGGDALCPLLAHPKILPFIKNPPKDPPYDALIVEVFGAPCFYIIGHLLNVPIITVSALALFPWSHNEIANPENLAFISNTLLDYPQSMSFWQRMHNFVYGVVQNELYQRATAKQDDLIRETFGEGLPSIRELERRVSMILTNTHSSLVGNRPTTPAYIDVGGLHVQPSSSAQVSPSLEKWMNESTDGFVYFTFGSMVLIESFPREIILTFYRSLAKLAPIRVLMKAPQPSLLPAGLPANVLTQAWMPQLKILQHPNVKAFITHGGLMGTQEAIYCGVPLIGLPLFVDQFINIQIYVSKKVAVKLDLPTLTEESLDAALDAVLNDPSYRDTVRKTSALFRDRPMNPSDTAVYWIEYVIKHGADVLRSPALDLTWWQRDLLDVYAFLLLVMLAILLAIATAVRFLVGLVVAGTKVTARAKKLD